MLCIFSANIQFFILQKLDEVFGVIRSESIDDIKKTEITVRGMGKIDLSRQKIKRNEVEHNKMDEYEQKRVGRQQIAMPEKPATYKKPKKSIPKEETPPKPPSEPIPEDPPEPVSPPKPVETPKPKKKTNFVFISKVPTPPKEPTPPPKEPTPPREKTPDLQTKFWPTPKLPTPEPPEPVPEQEQDLIQMEPEKPLKLGINGFDRIGRLAFRTALESGMDVAAINDPFIPLHYMVYSLKFDIAHSKTRRKDMNVIESPNGQLIINDKHVNVFKEVDPRKIPWNAVGVNYVIEATESLQSKVNAMHHLKLEADDDDGKVMAMEDLVNKKDNSGEISECKSTVNVCERTVKKVVVASNSTEFPSFGIGINDERLSGSSNVICSISPQANALVLPLKIVHQAFGVKFCSYTFLKAVMGPSKDIKCPTLGPSSHKKVAKWDFSENLVPAPCPSLEEEAVRYLPSM